MHKHLYSKFWFFLEDPFPVSFSTETHSLQCFSTISHNKSINLFYICLNWYPLNSVFWSYYSLNYSSQNVDFFLLNRFINYNCTHIPHFESCFYWHWLPNSIQSLLGLNLKISVLGYLFILFYWSVYSGILVNFPSSKLFLNVSS